MLSWGPIADARLGSHQEITVAMISIRSLARLAALGAVSTLAACGSSTTSTTTTSSTTSSSTTSSGGYGSTTTAAGATSGTSGTPVRVTLSHVPAGTVRLSWDSTTKHVVAAFDMYGFSPSSSHAVHLHAGSCLNQGNVVVPFPNLTANSTGAFTGTLTSSTTTPSGIPSGTYLNVHLAPSSQLGKPGSLSFTPIACGDVPSGSTSSATVTMGALPQAGQHPSGTATLTYSATAKKLTVAVSVTGLVPGSAHAAHIHLGSCQAQGPVKYPLTTLTAGSSGAAQATTVIPSVTSPPPSSGWYVNLHLGSPSQLFNANKTPSLYFQPIVCGNVS